MTTLPVPIDPGPIAYCTCGRRLTAEKSRRCGKGPVCWAKAHPGTPRPGVRRRAVMAAVPPRRPAPPEGQLEFDLSVEEVALW